MEEVNEQIKPNQCPKCFRILANKRSLAQHIKKKIPCDSVKNYCRICDQQFPNPNGLYRHREKLHRNMDCDSPTEEEIKEDKAIGINYQKAKAEPLVVHTFVERPVDKVNVTQQVPQTNIIQNNNIQNNVNNVQNVQNIQNNYFQIVIGSDTLGDLEQQKALLQFIGGNQPGGVKPLHSQVFNTFVGFVTNQTRPERTVFHLSDDSRMTTLFKDQDGPMWTTLKNEKDTQTIVTKMTKELSYLVLERARQKLVPAHWTRSGKKVGICLLLKIEPEHDPENLFRCREVAREIIIYTGHQTSDKGFNYVSKIDVYTHKKDSYDTFKILEMNVLMMDGFQFLTEQVMKKKDELKKRISELVFEPMEINKMLRQTQGVCQMNRTNACGDVCLKITEM